MSPLLAFLLALPYVMSSFSATPTTLVLGTLVTLVITIILTLVASGAIIYIIGQEHIDRPVGAGRAINYALQRLGDLFVASVLVGLVIFVGFLLLIIPGLIFLTWYMLTTQVVILERRGGVNAMSRSKALTAGFRLRVFGLMFVTTLLGNLATRLVEAGLDAALPMTTEVRTALQVTQQLNTTNYIIHQVVLFLVSTLFSTYTSICLTLAYFDLRVRKEGFDLEIAARSDLEAAGA